MFGWFTRSKPIIVVLVTLQLFGLYDIFNSVFGDIICFLLEKSGFSHSFVSFNKGIFLQWGFFALPPMMLEECIHFLRAVHSRLQMMYYTEVESVNWLFITDKKFYFLIDS